jgi:hypothetical protein
MIMMFFCDFLAIGIFLDHDVVCDHPTLNFLLNHDVIFYQLVLGLRFDCDYLTLNLLLHYDVYDFPILNFFSFFKKV